jgi:hypothetical protein
MNSPAVMRSVGTMVSSVPVSCGTPNENTHEAILFGLGMKSLKSFPFQVDHEEDGEDT